MSNISGSIRDISLSGRLFAVAADADPGRKLGGFMNTVESNGDGGVRVIQVREPWSLDGLTIAMNDDNRDQEFIQDLIDNGVQFVVAVTFADQSVYQGLGQIVGEAPKASQAGTGEIALMGEQKLTRQ